jgi:hypothetical protein
MSRKAIPAILVAAILSAGVWAFLRWRESEAATRIPSPPAVQSKAVAAHLAAKYDEARNEAASPAAVGALCVGYHADMFFDEADRCYALVSELDSSQWRWRYYRALIQAERGGGEPLVGGGALQEVGRPRRWHDDGDLGRVRRWRGTEEEAGHRRWFERGGVWRNAVRYGSFLEPFPGNARSQIHLVESQSLLPSVLFGSWTQRWILYTECAIGCTATSQSWQDACHAALETDSSRQHK